MELAFSNPHPKRLKEGLLVPNLAIFILAPNFPIKQFLGCLLQI